MVKEESDMEQGLGEGRFLVVCVCCLLEKPGDCDQQAKRELTPQAAPVGVCLDVWEAGYTYRNQLRWGIQSLQCKPLYDRARPFGSGV